MSPTAVLNLHTQGYVHHGSVNSPHKELFPPTVVLSLHIQSCNLFLHIKSYVLVLQYGTQLFMWDNTAVGDITLYVEE
jgi:hypothetical protein